MDIPLYLFRGQTRRKGEKVNPFGGKLPGTWVYGGVLSGNGDKSIIYRNEGTAIRKHVVYTDTLGVFSGKRDKNGAGIFSGDIIQFMNRYGYDCYAIVRFGEYEQDGSGNEYPPTRCLGFFVEVDSFTCPDGEDGAESFPVHLYRQNLLEVCEDCTVIGNLWDNDDLVEGRK